MVEVIFKCHKCGVDTDTSPNLPALAICENCCEDHDYTYEAGERRHTCKYCGKERPYDW